MRKLFSALLILTVSFLVGAKASDQNELTVTGEQVNLRSGPSTQFEIVGGVVRGESLFIAGEQQGEWFAVRPPESVNFWIHNEFVQSGKVIAAKAQVRTGPGINFGSVILLRKGDRITVRDQVDEWIKIAPPAGSVLWVNASYVRRGQPETTSVVRNEAPETHGAAIPAPDAVPPAPATVPAPVHVPVAAPAPVDVPVRPVSVALPAATPAPVPPPASVKPAPLSPAPAPQAVQVPTATYTGILRPVGFMLRPPADFRLVTQDKHGRAITVCYVYGNKTQLMRLEGRQLILTGRIYRLNGVPYPVLEPSLIKRLN